MRDHGIDMPDPQFDENGGVSISRDGGDGPTASATTTTFEAAAEECGQDGDASMAASPAGGAGDGPRHRSPTARAADVRGWIIAGGAVVRRRRRRHRRACSSATGPHDGEAAADDTDASRQLVAVEQRDLSRTEELDGTTGHGDARPARARRASGTLTALPDGRRRHRARRGDRRGRRPARSSPCRARCRCGATSGRASATARTCCSSSTSLAALGYAEDATASPSTRTGRAPRRAPSKAFQEDHGQDDDGTIDVGEIVWIDGPVRIDGVAGVLGQDAAEAGIEVTGADPDRARRRRRRGRRPRAGRDRGRRRAADRRDRSTARSRRSAPPRPADDGTATIPVDVTVSGGDPLPDGMPVDGRRHDRRRRRRARRAGRGRARPGRGRLRPRGRRRQRRRPTSCGSSSACSPTASVAVTGDVAAGDQVVVP